MTIRIRHILSAAVFGLLFFQAGTAADKYVVGYYPSWTKSTLPYTAMQYQNLTHIAYAFLVPAADGSVAIPAGFLYPELNQAAHAKGVKVVISLGGWGQSDGFSPMVADTAARHKFVQNITNFCVTYSYDGVDLDWEYPKTAADRTNLTALIHELRQSFNAVNSAYAISVACPATSYSGQWFDFTSMGNDFSWIGIMTYDFYGTWTATSGPNAPLYGNLSRNPDGWIDYSVGYYATTRGVPSARLLIGTPFYGWMYTASSMYGTSSGASQMAYSSIALKLTQGWTRSWDSQGQVPYMINAAKTQVISYDDSQSVSLKCDYIKSKGVGGTIIWAIGQDYTGSRQPLLEVIGATLRAPSVVREIESSQLPSTITLAQNYPNPFNGETVIRYSVANSGHVTMKLFDVLGREVMTLVDSDHPIGVYEVSLSSSALTSGIYFYRMQYQNTLLTRSLIVVQ
jgi:chitinase